MLGRLFGTMLCGLDVGWLFYLHHQPVGESILAGGAVCLIMTMFLTNKYNVKR